MLSILLSLLSFFGYIGFLAFKDSQRDQRLALVLSEINKKQMLGISIKQRFVNAVQEDSSTMSKYVIRCEHVEVVLNEYEQMLIEMSKLEQDIADNLGSGEKWQKVRKMTDVYKRIFDIDVENAKLVRKEVELAKELRGLSLINQQELYKTKIMSIKESETQLVGQEKQMMRDAIATGVQVPEEWKKLATD